MFQVQRALLKSFETVCFKVAGVLLLVEAQQTVNTTGRVVANIVYPQNETAELKF